MGKYLPYLSLTKIAHQARGDSAELAQEIRDDGYRRGLIHGWLGAVNALEKLIFHDGLTPIEAFRVESTNLFQIVRDWCLRKKGIIEREPDLIPEPPYEIQQPNPGYVYFLRADNGLFKIGMTKELNKRIKQLGIQLPYELQLVHAIGTDERCHVEEYFHLRFAQKRVRGEWFALTDSDIVDIQRIKYILTCGISEDTT